jgi:hypothetical protein
MMDNKADTLTQSQMLKVADCPVFLQSQPKEINGFIDMDVFDIQPIHTKPSDARLFSLI